MLPMGCKKLAHITENPYPMRVIWNSQENINLVQECPSVDPLASKFPESSPYVFCRNSPILFVDVDGRAAGLPPFMLTPPGNLFLSLQKAGDVSRNLINEVYQATLAGPVNILRSDKSSTLDKVFAVASIGLVTTRGGAGAKGLVGEGTFKLGELPEGTTEIGSRAGFKAETLQTLKGAEGNSLKETSLNETGDQLAPINRGKIAIGVTVGVGIGAVIDESMEAIKGEHHIPGPIKDPNANSGGEKNAKVSSAIPAYAPDEYK